MNKIETILRESLRAILKNSPITTLEIAEKMSEILEETITIDMIYSWTAKSKALHHIWASRLSAFCQVTGNYRPLEIVCESAGMFCLPGPEALRAEIQTWRETEQRASRERKKRELFLKEMEG